MANADKPTNSIQTLPVGDVLEERKTDPSGQLPGSRVISAISPVVVRQDAPAGPSHQEALGYTFLVNAPKYPGLAAMDDVKLVLTLSRALNPPAKVAGPDDGRTEAILFSGGRRDVLESAAPNLRLSHHAHESRRLAVGAPWLVGRKHRH